ncbi:MAG TPA: ABC transporter permease [Fibrobacteres bacterium]|nr:ABC transporter permease [Fibrobacterota bacterium]
MNFIKAIIIKELRQLKADPIMGKLIIFPVLIQMFVLGYAITTEVKNTTITIVDKSNTPQSVSLVQTITHNKLFRYIGPAGSEYEAKKMLDCGRAKLALVIPADFTLKSGKNIETPISLLIDGQDANSSNVAAGYLNAIILGWNLGNIQKKTLSAGMPGESIAPVSVRTAILFNPLLKSTWYMIPALAVILVTMVTALLTGFSIVKEKESGTLEQLMVTPLKPIHLILGKIIPFIVIGLLELCAVLAIATLWFGIPFRGNFLLLILFALVYIASSLGIGILTSTVSRTPQQVLFLTFFVMIFFLLLSGFFIPIENMPDWVQKLTCINPLRYFMFIIREIFLKGSGMAQLWREGLYMAIIGVVVLSGALLTFKRRTS